MQCRQCRTIHLQAKCRCVLSRICKSELSNNGRVMKSGSQQFLLLVVDTIKVANIFLAFQNTTLYKRLLRIWLHTIIIIVLVISRCIIGLHFSEPFNSFVCNCPAITAPTKIISKLFPQHMLAIGLYLLVILTATNCAAVAWASTAIFAVTNANT
jgi:hypothetical protein